MVVGLCLDAHRADVYRKGHVLRLAPSLARHGIGLNLVTTITNIVRMFRYE